MNATLRNLLLLSAMIVSAASVNRTANGITIAAAKLLPSGNSVTIDSAVISNTVDLVSSSSVASFEAQDATGGVTVFGSTTDIGNITSAFPAGNAITFSGTTSSFSGLFEIQPIFTNVVTPNVGVPAPIVTSTADYQNLSPTAELRESELVSLANVHFTGIASGQTFAGLTNYTATDGVLNVIVRVSTASQSLVGQPIPTGQVNLSGIFTQFDGSNPPPGVPGVGYELALIDNSSVSAVPEPTSILPGMMLAAIGGCGLRQRVRW